MVYFIEIFRSCMVSMQIKIIKYSGQDMLASGVYQKQTTFDTSLSEM